MSWAKIKRYRGLAGAVFLGIVPVLALAATGLSTSFVDVQLEGVPVGHPYVVKTSAGDGLRVKNLGASTVRVRVSVILPAPGDLRGGAESLPDAGWVHIVPDVLDIPPSGEARCRITLKVPSQKAYQGKYYQAMIWSRGEVRKERGVALSAGLISRLRFKTNP